MADAEACGKDHIMHDEDVMQIVKLTQVQLAFRCTVILSQSQSTFHAATVAALA